MQEGASTQGNSALAGLGAAIEVVDGTSCETVVAHEQEVLRADIARVMTAARDTLSKARDTLKVTTARFRCEERGLELNFLCC